MRGIGGIKIIMIAALALIILAGTGAAVSLSNSGGGTWKYQRDISIKENSGTTLTDYQVLIELKGADFPSEAESDGADIRFTDVNGNELNYWIESWDYAGKSAKMWVKVPSILASSNTVIRMYYGNHGANSVINGDRTFEFFDDFESGNMNKWDNHPNWNIVTDIVKEGKFAAKGYFAGRSAELTKYINMNKGVYEGWFRFEENDLYHYPFIPLTRDYDIYAVSAKGDNHFGYFGLNNYYNYPLDITYEPGVWYKIRVVWDIPMQKYWVYINDKSISSDGLPAVEYIGNWKGRIVPSDSYMKSIRILAGANDGPGQIMWVENVILRKYASTEPTITLLPSKSSLLSIIKSASPYSLRQFQESTIKVLIENSGTSEVKAIEIMDPIHPSFDLTGGDFPNPKKFDSIRAGESRELQYTIKSKESGAFTLDPATVTYADSEGNIQEVKSEPVSIKVVTSSEGGAGSNSPYELGSSSAVLLHGEKTDVVLGEDILLKLSAVNLINKPPMTVQVILYPPSGMSVTGSEFVKSGAGIFTTTYTLNPGDGKDIEVHIKSNQVGDFGVKGRIVYYFGENKEATEDHTLTLPIKVRKEPEQTTSASQNNGGVNPKAPGFAGGIAIIGILFVALLIKKR